MSDLLEQATKALKAHESADADALAVAATRARILASAAAAAGTTGNSSTGKPGKAPAASPKRLPYNPFALKPIYYLPIAAIFACMTVWAAASEYRTRKQLESMANSANAATPPNVVAARAYESAFAAAAEQLTSAAAPEPSAPASTAARAAAIPTSSAPSALEAPIPAAPRQALPAPTKAAVAGMTTQQAAEEDALYRSAHEVHFARRDWPAAITAWSAYLSKSPNGRFAPEALYNRALCQHRLHQFAEARSGLTSFAQGVYGDYRKQEATQLIESMDLSTP